MKHLILIPLLALSACKEEVSVIPDPIPLTEEALSHFCQMNISEHGGPKGQIHLAGLDQPHFLCAGARSWSPISKVPNATRRSRWCMSVTWGLRHLGTNRVSATGSWQTTAVFVVGAGVAGGMGAPEIVPFADPDAAKAFIATYGGEAVTFELIPDDAALAPVDLDQKLETPA